MYLSGYGVELAIKSTEYKAVDDTQVKGMLCLVSFFFFFHLWYPIRDTIKICYHL